MAEMADKPADFEKSLDRLGKIVHALEGGELSLDESLKLFEEGVTLSRSAQERLEHAEKRIEELLSVSETGTPKTKPLDHGEP
jgi:exodeoxyribonuclease VII small subunit